VRHSAGKLLRHLFRIGSIAPLLIMLDASVASADPVPQAERVILLTAKLASPAVRRSLARIGDELSADRIEVVMADSGTTDDPGHVIESMRRATGDDTILVLFGDPATGRAELCVVQRAAQRTAVRRAIVVADDPEQMPELLALRALELLRATALELSIASDPSAKDSYEPVQRRLETPVPRSPSPRVKAAEAALVSLDLGLGVWKSAGGPAPAVVPVGRVGLRLSDWASARVSLAGLGSRPSIQTRYGSATLSQDMALVECVAVTRFNDRVRPTLSLGAGVLHVAVAGSGIAPYQGLAPTKWSAVFDAGASVAFAVSPSQAVVPELHVLIASPHPVVRFADTRAATIGYPSLMFTLSLRVSP
jgi:hypothetical protein